MQMNDKQRLVLKVALGLFAVALLFPPFEVRGNGYVINAGYSLIFAPPVLSVTPYVNLPMLVAQWVAIAVVAGGLIVLLKDAKS